jgi:dCMP deaminase
MDAKRQDELNKYFMEIAKLTGALSHCCSKKVGAVLTKDNKLIASGYNGTAPGQHNCDEVFGDLDLSVPENRKLHHEFSLREEIHAEVNAIIDAGKRETLEPDSTLYVTLAPCENCGKIILAAGIKKIFYKDEYDLGDDKGIAFLRRSGIEVIKL